MTERAERRERRRLIDARFPQIKRLEDFRFADDPTSRRPRSPRSPKAPGSTTASGHLHRRLAAPARRSWRPRSRSAPATKAAASASPRSPALANELQEAQSRRELARVVGRYARTELVVLDELGYLALPDGAAELVFQVLSERHERGSLIVTTNLPFGEWTKVFPDPRLAKAVVDRLTHRAHIIDTGNESWRFRHGLTRKTKTTPNSRPMTAPARPSPLHLALRAQLRDDGRAAPTPAIRQHPTADQPTRSGATSGRRGGATASRRSDTAQLCPLLCPPAPTRRCRAKAPRNHNPRVGGSSPSSGMRSTCKQVLSADRATRNTFRVSPTPDTWIWRRTWCRARFADISVPRPVPHAQPDCGGAQITLTRSVACAECLVQAAIGIARRRRTARRSSEVMLPRAIDSD